MTLQPMTCKEFVELVTDYLEGKLNQDDRARFAAHLAVCQGCETYLDQFKETIRLTGMLSEDHISPEAQERLLESFRDWNHKND